MNSRPDLEDAILLAAESHRGKKDKAGNPYILHVLIVMFRLESDEERIVGALHDIVEETSVTLKRLKALGYSDRVVDAIDCLTWRKKRETYKEYLKRLKPNDLAAAVKRADLADHLTPSINGGPTWLEKHYPKLYKRYVWALSKLGRWKVLGQDAFDTKAGMYTKGEYITETEALHAAYKYLVDLDETQPASESGGQRSGGLQDRVYIEAPDGKIRRITAMKTSGEINEKLKKAFDSKRPKGPPVKLPPYVPLKPSESRRG